MENIDEDIEKDINEKTDNMTESEDVLENDEKKNKVIFEPKTKNDKLKVDCWNNDKNGDLTPRDISKKSRKMCWFLCDVCGHDFARAIKHVVLNNKWCQYCDENIVCDNDDCEICYTNSFASFGE